MEDWQGGQKKERRYSRTYSYAFAIGRCQRLRCLTSGYASYRLYEVQKDRLLTLIITECLRTGRFYSKFPSPIEANTSVWQLICTDSPVQIHRPSTSSSMRPRSGPSCIKPHFIYDRSRSKDWCLNLGWVGGCLPK
jgi:hypothetical protein